MQVWGRSLKIRLSLSLEGMMSIIHFHNNILHLGLPLVCHSFLKVFSGMELVGIDNGDVVLGFSWVRILYWELTGIFSFLLGHHLSLGELGFGGM